MAGALSRGALTLRLGLVVLFALAITLPFINQAFHIDDAIFWDFAKARLESPWGRHVSDYQLIGENFTAWRDTHPPADALYLALVMRLTGSDAEVPLHAGFILFPITAGVAMFFLARRFIRHALLAAVMLLATPAVMVLSHTLMADAPMMAAWLAATALYVHGVDRDSGPLLWLAGAAASLAALIGYQALALVVMLPVYPALLGRLSLKNLAPLLAPLAAFGLYVLAGVLQYGSLPRFSHANGTSFAPRHLLDRIEGMLLHSGGISVFPLALIATFSLRRRRYLALPLVAAGAIALGLYQRHAVALTAASTLIYICLMTAAAMLLLGVISEVVVQYSNARRGSAVDTGFLFLAAWMLLAMSLIIILLPHVTAKYTLIFMAPLVLITLRELELGLAAGSRWDAIAATVLVLTLLTGSALSVADYRLAAGYRDFAASVAGRYPDAGEVWFVGEWGLRHYLEAAGYRYLTSDNESPAAGDLIISPSVADWPLAPSLAARVSRLEQVEDDWPVPLRLMSMKAEAGFYGTYWGLLPFAVADVPVETYEVMIVGPRPAPGAGDIGLPAVRPPSAR